MKIIKKIAKDATRSNGWKIIEQLDISRFLVYCPRLKCESFYTTLRESFKML